MKNSTMANDSYLPQLLVEKDTIDSTFVHASKLLSKEIDRVKTGGAADQKFIEIHNDNPQKHSQKVLIPIKEFPKFNFVGKLLGPKGHTLKALQEQTGCKLSILGRGSIRDRNKEEEMRKEGGKYAHLNDDLHVLIEVFAPPPEAFQRIAGALAEVKKFLLPEFNEEIQQQQYEQMVFMSGSDEGGMSRGGRGGRGSRGSPAGGRGGRGGMGRGGGSSLLPSPRGRGGMRGGPRGAPPRGAPGRGMSRGGSSGRGGAPPSRRPEPASQAPLYEEDSYSYGAGAGSGYPDAAPSYSAGNGSSGYADDTAAYGDPYAESASAAGGDAQYFDYSSGAAVRAGAGAASQNYEYAADSWGQSPAAYGKAAGGGRGAKSDYRPHPYSAPSRGGGGMARY